MHDTRPCPVFTRIKKQLRNSTVNRITEEYNDDVFLVKSKGYKAENLTYSMLIEPGNCTMQFIFLGQIDNCNCSTIKKNESLKKK